MNRASSRTALALSALVALGIGHVSQGCDDGGTGGSAGSGGGSSSSSGGLCVPGETRACYTVPDTARNTGVCRDGVDVCGPAGVWSASCALEVLPAEELCGNGIDEDCDGSDKHAAACLAESGSDGLLARYFINEEAGQMPLVLHDAAAESPLDLTLVSLDPANMTTGLSERDKHRGLFWVGYEYDAAAFASVGGTKLEMSNVDLITMEAVVDINEVSSSGSPIIYFGPGTDFGVMDLRAFAVDSLSLYWNGVEVGRWRPQLDDRCVIHLVLDTSQTAETAKLYRNSVLVPADAGLSGPPTGSTVNLDATQKLTLGNRANGGRSFGGWLYYAAIYGKALSAEEVSANTKLLLLDDDNLMP